MSEFLQGDLRKYVFTVDDFNDKTYINLRLYERYDPTDEKAWRPTHKGLFIPIEYVGQLKVAIDRLLSEIEFEKEEEQVKSKSEG